MGGFNNKELARQAGQKSSRAGISDKMTMQTREHFKSLVENNLSRLQSDLDELEPKERIDCILKLASFILPKLAAVDITTQGEQLERYVTISPVWNVIDAKKKQNNE